MCMRWVSAGKEVLKSRDTDSDSKRTDTAYRSPACAVIYLKKKKYGSVGSAAGTLKAWRMRNNVIKRLRTHRWRRMSPRSTGGLPKKESKASLRLSI